MKEKKTHIEEMPESAALYSYIEGTATTEEEKAVGEWLLKEESNRKKLLQIARIYFTQYSYDRIRSRDPLQAFSEVEKKIGRTSRRIWLKRIATVAACIGGAVILSWLPFPHRGGDAAHKPQLITVTSYPGMRSHFTLPDGTIAYLNSGTTLTYPIPYDEKERRVELCGEAFFEVVSNEKQPFIVSTLDDKLRVRVLGTQFNMQVYHADDVAQTTLISGSVSLEVRDSNGTQTEYRLQPSDKAIYDLVNGKIRVESVNPEYDIAWIDGKLLFKDTPMPEVLKKLSHFYNVNFDVKDKVIESYSFTGTFIDRQLFQVLDYLELSSEINYTINRTREDDSKGVKQTTITLRKKKS